MTRWFVVDSYFAEFNAGNDEAVLALIAPDAPINWFGSISIPDHAKFTAFLTGQGTTLTLDECRVTEEVPGEFVRLLCEFGTRDGAMAAVGAPPFNGKMFALVTPDGIEDLSFTYEARDHTEVGVPFYRWMAEHHPDVELPGFDGNGARGPPQRKHARVASCRFNTPRSGPPISRPTAAATSTTAERERQPTAVTTPRKRNRPTSTRLPKVRQPRVKPWSRQLDLSTARRLRTR